MSYNGWSNYETWAVALWLDNEEGSYSYWHDQARSALDDETRDYDASDAVEMFDELRANAVTALAAMLENEHNDAAPDLSGSVFADLLTAALSDVDWHEVAEHYIDEHAESVLSDAREAVERDALDD